MGDRVTTALYQQSKKFDSCCDEKENTLCALKFEFYKHRSDVSRSSFCFSNSSQTFSPPSSNIDTITMILNGKNILPQYFDTMISVNVKLHNSYQEIDNYLNSDLSSDCRKYYVDDDIDVLSYRREKRHQFLRLQNIAKQTQYSSVPILSWKDYFSAAKKYSQ